MFYEEIQNTFKNKTNCQWSTKQIIKLRKILIWKKFNIGGNIERYEKLEVSL